jgi:glc operon protein GlcG
MNWQSALGTMMVTCYVACFASDSLGATEPVSGASSAIIRPPALNPDAALAMVEACRAFAKKNNWHVSIAVVDPSGGLMAFFRMENTSFNSIQSAQLKAKTSAIVRSSTKDLADMVTSNANPALVASHQLAMGFYAAQGGLPISVEGVVIGAVAAAGQGPAEDEQCARVGLDAGLNLK